MWWLFNRKRRKKDLREKCRELYGDDFLILYDTICAEGGNRKFNGDNYIYEHGRKCQDEAGKWRIKEGFL